ncbi:MAG TPA: hypothetical protein VHY22_01290 [Chthoniobacteraceae bacterium]|jgi:hypothetical protein|nr:hypothetical protein [Chthoniobacteraceae bacterium]
MNEQERAEEHLRTIRRLMERGTIYRAISAPTALVGGVLSILAFLIYTPPRIEEGNFFPFPAPEHRLNRFIVIWVFVLLLTAAANTLFIVLGARQRGERVLSASMKTALAAIAPAFILGGALAALFAPGMFEPGVNFDIAVMWVSLYGVGLLATSQFAPRSLTILGLAFLTSGITAIVAIISLFSKAATADAIGDGRYASLLMLLTFGLYHLIYAACVWPRKRAEPEQ